MITCTTACSRHMERVIGVLHLQANKRYGYSKKGAPLYRFTPLSRTLTPAPGPAKVGFRRAREHAFRDVYVVVEYVEHAGGAPPTGAIGARALLVDVLGPLDAYAAGLLAIQYRHVGYRRARLCPSAIAPAQVAQKPGASTPRSPCTAARESTTGCEDAIYCTIDPEGCRDIDDAVGFVARSCASGSKSGGERERERTYELSVSITDVNACVAPGDAVDAYYQRQASSLYRPDGTVSNALPAALATDRCSLQPGVARRHFIDGFLR